jgi:hypothetical protein
MKTTGRLLAISFILGGGLLVMPGTASADSPVVPQGDYETAYAAAADASGVFAPGATVNFTTHGWIDGDLNVTVNPDGSLVGSKVRTGSTTSVKCVRVDRCWEQAATSFGDMKWHLLPAGSVTYQLARDYWSSWMGFPWPAGSTFMLAALDDGTPAYAVAMTAGGLSVLNVAAFTGPSVDNVVEVADDSGWTPVRSGTMTATTTPTPVVPPAKKATGTKATQLEHWVFPINH